MKTKRRDRVGAGPRCGHCGTPREVANLGQAVDGAMSPGGAVILAPLLELRVQYGPDVDVFFCPRCGCISCDAAGHSH